MEIHKVVHGVHAKISTRPAGSLITEQRLACEWPEETKVWMWCSLSLTKPSIKGPESECGLANRCTNRIRKDLDIVYSHFRAKETDVICLLASFLLCLSEMQMVYPVSGRKSLSGCHTESFNWILGAGGNFFPERWQC